MRTRSGIAEKVEQAEATRLHMLLIGWDVLLAMVSSVVLYPALGLIIEGTDPLAEYVAMTAASGQLLIFMFGFKAYSDYERGAYDACRLPARRWLYLRVGILLLTCMLAFILLAFDAAGFEDNLLLFAYASYVIVVLLHLWRL